MRSRPATRENTTAGRDGARAVDEFLRDLKHPHKVEVEALRALVLAAAPGMEQGLKWNAPSYRTTEWFATTHLRGKGTVGLILHLGAKARASPVGGLQVADPAGLLKWLANDRAMVEFRSLREIEANARALQQLLRDWLQHV